MKKTIGILDIETGGFSVSKNGICEVGLLVVSEELEVIQELSFLIKPYTRDNDTDELVSYKDDAMAVHGITMEELETEGILAGIASDLLLHALNRYNVRALAGHNVKAFDIPRIEYLVQRFSGSTIKGYDSICTLEASRHFLKEPSYKLDDICQRNGIKQVRAHRALSDCYSVLGLLKLLTEKGLKIKKDENIIQ